MLNLKDIVIDVSTALNVRCLEQNVTLNLNLDDVIINANQQEMMELVRNLIDNAIKYNKTNGSVDVTLKEKYLQVC